MTNHTSNLFYSPDDFDDRFSNDGHPAGYFFGRLLERAEAMEASGRSVEITLVGHSMGAIVLNNAFVRYKEEFLKSSAVKNVVYMAAAATINDSLNSLAPILTDERGTDATVPNFFNLTLNRVAEVSERHALGMVPTGSLLVSIDQHHEKPVHPLERTFGSETNVLSSIRVIDKILGESPSKVVFKAFDRFSGEVPQVHGDFSSIPFWKRETWSVNPGRQFK